MRTFGTKSDLFCPAVICLNACCKRSKKNYIFFHFPLWTRSLLIEMMPEYALFTTGADTALYAISAIRACAATGAGSR